MADETDANAVMKTLSPEELVAKVAQLQREKEEYQNKNKEESEKRETELKAKLEAAISEANKSKEEIQKYKTLSEKMGFPGISSVDIPSFEDMAAQMGVNVDYLKNLYTNNTKYFLLSVFNTCAAREDYAKSELKKLQVDIDGKSLIANLKESEKFFKTYPDVMLSDPKFPSAYVENKKNVLHTANMLLNYLRFNSDLHAVADIRAGALILTYTKDENNGILEQSEIQSDEVSRQLEEMRSEIAELKSASKLKDQQEKKEELLATEKKEEEKNELLEASEELDSEQAESEEGEPEVKPKRRRI
jgi:hypothetical protein